jgi:hypothetical protein
LIEWANNRIPQDLRIKQFKDKSLSTSKFFFALLRTIDERIINPDLITAGKVLEIILKVKVQKMLKITRNTPFLLQEN